MAMNKAKLESLYDDAGDTTHNLIKEAVERHPNISYADALACVDAALEAFADELSSEFDQFSTG